MYTPNGVNAAPVGGNVSKSVVWPNRKPEPGCYDVFPEQACYTECSPCAPNPCKCPPKTRINTCIKIKYGMKEISFLLANWPCEPEVIPAHLHCWSVDIRNRGECQVRARMKPTRADITGRAWFALPEAFFRLGEGNYEFDFMLDGKCSLTQCLTVAGVRPYLKEVGFADPMIYCAPPECAPQIEESAEDAAGQLLPGDCNAQC